MASADCQVGGLFSRCRNPSEHTCQYCGRQFCGEHTGFAEGHEAVCSRGPCRAKREDLDAHLSYRAHVEQRNHAGLCGIDECGPHPGYSCSLCRGYFCSAHLSDRLYPFKDGWATIERPVSVCDRCWQRRKIWKR